MVTQLCPTVHRALLALNATNESASDVLFWIDKAQEWLAIDNECEDEAKKMGAAMQLSLQEKELRQAEEVPLAERSSEDVCAFFGGISDFFRILEASKELEQLKMLMDKALSLKTAILDYLEMEKLCKGWWSFSTGYFQDAAKEIQDNIREILGDNSQELKDNCTAIQSTGGPNAKGDLPALYIDSTLENAGVKNLEPLRALFAGRAQELKDNVYCRPEGNGNFIPKIFAAYVTQEGGYLSD